MADPPLTPPFFPVRMPSRTSSELEWSPRSRVDNQNDLPRSREAVRASLDQVQPGWAPGVASIG